MAREAGSRRNTQNSREKWRRRPDLNRGWRFCRFREVVLLDGWSCFLVLGPTRFYVVFGRCCSRIVLESRIAGPDGHGALAYAADAGPATRSATSAMLAPWVKRCGVYEELTFALSRNGQPVGSVAPSRCGLPFRKAWHRLHPGDLADLERELAGPSGGKLSIVKPTDLAP